jgi:hypothetical protein
VLDLWVVVVVWVMVLEVALSATLNGGRFDLGFYLGRIYGLAAVSFVLLILLVENGRLYAQLAARQAELLRLSAADPLTTIANRRAFDEALETEWRQALTERTTLALLLIDVDCFKPFNDNYGHVVGDRATAAMSLRSCSREPTRNERLRSHGTCARAFATWACRTPIPTSRPMSQSQSASPVFQWVSKRSNLRPLFWSKRRITRSMPPRRRAAIALPKTWLRPVAGLSRSVMGVSSARRRFSRPVQQAGDKREPIRAR